MLETLLEKNAAWSAGNGPQAEMTVCTRGGIVRNLADFSFPWRCSDDERAAVADRVANAIKRSGLLPGSQYIPLDHAEPRELRFLLERRLITEDLIRAEGPRGVHISADQDLCVMVNGLHHLHIQAIAPGLQPEEVWKRLNLADDQLARRLDYTFDSNLGYLGPELARLGTGLRLSVLVHLPALALANAIRSLTQSLRDQWHLLEGAFGGTHEARGDLYWLSNQSTLGRSEDEIVFHLGHFAGMILSQEQSARTVLQSESPRSLEDRVGRAWGMVRGARLLDFDEALALLSSLRLGHALGMLEGCAVHQFNDLLLSAQRAHIESRRGHDCDELALGAERADLFQSLFAAHD
ncbi:MAG TPA: hypothetical protein PLO62_01480 [Candidatus Hydrogenedentes bacterium]|nr:hypothetical protein [Candidatus Hydrogenedentota bacterium]HOS02325.1 hypothetical protein [Candidatus Hydrogenedentota bacterium]